MKFEEAIKAAAEVSRKDGKPYKLIFDGCETNLMISADIKSHLFFSYWELIQKLKVSLWKQIVSSLKKTLRNKFSLWMISSVKF